ncbi:MAG: ROK family protein [Thermoleophilia bacterium]|nr:ROK family protein [Thermoleophilia bacterium]
MKSVLGVDIGGSKIAIVPVGPAGNQLAMPLLGISRTSSREAFLANLESMLRQGLREFERFSPVAVGLACAGTINHEKGIVVASPNLPLSSEPLAERLAGKLGLPVFLENDANAALVGEAAVGAAVGHRDVVMVTLGTGVGGAIMTEGKLYRGASGAAGELGHMVVVAGGLPCACGGRGCLEMYASGSALARYGISALGDREKDPHGQMSMLQEEGKLTGRAVARLAEEGHPGAQQAVRQLGYWLGVGLVTIVNVFEPEMVVVGGGVSELGEMLLGPAREHLARYAMPPGRDRVKVVTAQLGNQAGMVGGALVAWGALGKG